MLPLSVCTCLLIIAGLANAQRFEVASLKPASPDAGASWGSSHSNGRYTVTRMPLRNLLLTAFKVKDHQLKTPSWMDSERYDIQAKTPEGAKSDQIPAMLLQLLVERFRMEYRKETRDLQGYTLSMAKGGPKLTESAAVHVTAQPEAPANGLSPVEMAARVAEMRARSQQTDKDGFPIPQPGTMSYSYSNGVTRMAADAIALKNLIGFLSRNVSADVVDETGLTGKYSFRLEYAGESAEMQRLRQTMTQRVGTLPQSEGAEPGGPNLFKALQDQLGLRLTPSKIPMDYIIVDKAEKTPIEN